MRCTMLCCAVSCVCSSTVPCRVRDANCLAWCGVCNSQVVEEHPLEDWKEVLVLLATYASPDQQFVTLCEALGDRLVRSGSEQFRLPATVCYICAFNPVKTIGQWLRALPEKAAVVGLPLAWYVFSHCLAWCWAVRLIGGVV